MFNLTDIKWVFLGETVHNQHEMIMNQNNHAHLHEHAHHEVASDDRIIPPHIVNEGPIAIVPAFQGEHFHGPGIRDQPDVHYEDEMDMSRYRYKKRMRRAVVVAYGKFEYCL